MEEQKKGFTIIELMLAMALLGTMLVAIAALVMRVTGIYQKGLSLRAVNTNGREIISDLTRTITSSPTHLKVNPDYTNNEITGKNLKTSLANYYLSVENTQHTEQYSGVFCTGSYSYVWNNAQTIANSRDTDDNNDENLFKIEYKEGPNTREYIPKFARFADAERFACAANEDTSGNANFTPVSMLIGHDRSMTMDDITELINNDEIDLAMYNFRILPAVQNETTKQIFFSGTFILATIRGGVNIQSNGDFCTGDKETTEDDEFSLNNFDYCAVNKFNFSARATGEASITNRNGDN